MKTQTITLEDCIKENALLKDEISYLKEQLDWFKKQLFGSKAEKFVDTTESNQLYFEGFDKIVPLEEKQRVEGHQRSIRKTTGQDKISFPADIPVEQYILDLPKEEKVCPETGEPLVKIGEEVTSKLAHKPGSYFIKQFIRPKYAYPKREEKGIAIANLPDTLLNRCQADESLLADILVKKYSDHLPLYRQAEIMLRDKINISRQVLCQWVLRASFALKPLYDLMTTRILESGNIFYDETPLKMLSPGRGKTKQTYMWVLAGGLSSNPNYRIYDFCTNRCHENAAKMLKDYRGVLHSDKYGAYENLANKKQLIWCPCWSHIRRKFMEAESGDLAFRNWVLRQIRYLFMLEKVAWARSEKERLRIRKEKEEPIIQKLIEAVKDKLICGKPLPKSKFREALGYFSGLIPHLKNYINYPWARLDNNVAERAVRPIAIGRKNWLFVGNENGGEACGIALSLIQTCRAFGINPREYLEDVMRRINSHPFNRLDELLPDNWQKLKQ
ncbi:MAG: IS66 family transposase [Proteobacteria bacterium]|jgi:transposase|nr:IS66 family transposase [Pseudomonadota bacterium]